MGLGLASVSSAARGLLALTNRIRWAHGEPAIRCSLLALARVLYGAVVAGGSGFLAVFVAGLLLGDADIPAKARLERFNAVIAGLAEIAVFVALGLTVDTLRPRGGHWRTARFVDPWPGPLTGRSWSSRRRSALGAEPRRSCFVAWSGLKGAVPILLAAFAVLGGVDDAERSTASSSSPCSSRCSGRAAGPRACPPPRAPRLLGRAPTWRRSGRPTRSTRRSRSYGSMNASGRTSSVHR